MSIFREDIFNLIVIGLANRRKESSWCSYYIIILYNVNDLSKSQVSWDILLWFSYKHFIFYGVYPEVAVFKEVNTSHTLIVAGLLPLPLHQAREASPSSSPGYFSRHLRFHSGFQQLTKSKHCREGHLQSVLCSQRHFTISRMSEKKYLYQETHIAGKKCGLEIL